MSRMPAIPSKSDNQYRETFDRIVAEHPAEIVWRRKPNGIWIAASVRETTKDAVSATPRRRGSKRTHCRRRHEYTPMNTYVRPDGSRDCRACLALRQEAERAEREAARSQRTDTAGLTLLDAARSEP